MKLTLQITFLLFTGIFFSNAQQKPTFIVSSEKVQIVPSLKSRKNLPAPVKKDEVNPKRKSGQNIIVPGKGFPKGNDPLLKNYKQKVSYKSTDPIMTFEAARNGATPTDPTGAAGPNHYVVAYNTAFKIFDKNGNVLLDDTALNALFPNYTNDGDPIVLYDQFADRFLISNFDVTSNPNKFLVAISQTSDPVNGGWYVYAFDVDSMPDYPKFSIWSDGYYVTANKDANTADTSEVVFAMERDKMIAGDDTALMIGFPLPNISVNGFYSPSGFNVNGNTLPPRGNAPIIFLQDDSWQGIDQDHLKIWNINVDWNSPSNSTISTPQELTTTAFNSVFNNGSFENLPQPDGSVIDALQATIMFMTNYRRFSNYNSTVLNFVVNTDGQGKAGIRWYELRQDQDGDPWYIYQEGTYIDPTDHNTFAGSINMDQAGNIALGYTIVDSDQFPELRYTGRFVADQLNQMTVTPQSFVPGTASDPSSRYGDYQQLVVDPSDDKTFWFIGEYFTNEGRIDQVGVFKLAPDFNDDVGIVNVVSPKSATLTANETVTVTIFNYGKNDQTDFPVSYQVDNGSVITENFTGTIASNTSVDFTFSATADLSTVGQEYLITASTNLSSDEDTSNDAKTVTVKNLEPNDMGVIAFVTPQSSDNLGASEPIQVTIQNFGGETQSDVPVSYTLNGNTVYETAAGPFEPNTSQNYTFSQTGDFSEIGLYTLSAKTSLTNDSDTTNDELIIEIKHNICEPQGDCTYGDYVSNLIFNTINNSSECGQNGYSDFTNISTDLEINNSYDMTITVKYSEEYVMAWIDFNDNFVFEDSEKIIPDTELGAGQEGAGTYSKTFSINIPQDALVGEHLMRIRTNWQDPVPDACTDVEYGETEDYKVNIIDLAGIDILQDEEIMLQNIGPNHYLVSLKSEFMKDDMTIEVYTVEGKRIVYHNLKNINGKYTYDLDLRFVSKGVYLLKIGNNQVGKIKKILVE